MYVDRDRKVAFIMHPRTGTTSLASVFPDSLKRIGTRHSVEPEIIEPDWDVGCVVRNPLDTLVSWYYVSGYRGDFQNWLYSRKFEEHMWIPKGLFFGLPYANNVLRFENLQEDWNKFCILMGWVAREIPRLNVGTRRKRMDWRHVVAGCKIPEIKLS
jgi:hypothetical protein